jgi:flagellin
LPITVTGTNSGVAQTLGVANVGNIAAGSVLNFDALGLKLTFSAATDFSNSEFDIKAIETSGSTMNFQIGANSNTTLDISIADMRSAGLGKTATNAQVADVSEVNVVSKDFSDNLEVLDAAIKEVSAQRSQLGAWQNRLDHSIKNLDTSSENLQAAESRIRDVDMAKEMMEFTKNNILQQAAQAMLAQANQAPQGVLQLLR